MSATSSVASENNGVLILDSLCKVCLFSSLALPSMDVGQISSLFPVFQDFVIMCLAMSMHCVGCVCSPAGSEASCPDESALVAMPRMTDSVASTQVCALSMVSGDIFQGPSLGLSLWLVNIIIFLCPYTVVPLCVPVF